MRRDENLEAEIARIVQSVNEWDDRTSPDDYPYHLLITSEELADILRNLAESLEFEALHLSHMDLLVEKAAAAGDAAVYEAMRSECFDPTIPDNVAEYVGNAIRSTLSAALSIEQTQPVAWMYQFKTKAPVLMVEKRNWAETHFEWTETPLYAHPPTIRIADSAEAGGSATSTSGTGGGE